MSPSLSKRQVNRERWFDRIERCKQSGLSQKAFCEQHHIGIASFRGWRAIVANEGKSKVRRASLLPVNIMTSVSVPSLGVCFGENLRLEIPLGFDAMLLQQVVEVLRTS